MLNCPFITTISEDEVDMYIQYLQSFNFENEQGWMDNWQDYEEIKEAYNSDSENRNFPEWYDFHNGRTGGSVYFLLPDIRGNKEEFYMNLWRKELHLKVAEIKKQEEEIKQQPDYKEELITTDEQGTIIDKRPWLDYHKKGWMKWFVNTFESKQTQENYLKFSGQFSFEDYDEFLEDDLRTLGESGEVIPIQGWYDWKEAIHKTAQNYRVRKIIEALPEAYQHYQMRVEMKPPFETSAEPIDYFDGHGKCILRGRELNGEPRDFDF